MNRGYMLPAKSVEYRTPRTLINSLESEFGKFDLDPAATAENTVCPRYYTKAENGLVQPWFGRVFCNPPYGHGLDKWVRKALEEVLSGRASLVIMLLPARTETAWFHRWIWNGYDHRPKARTEVRFLRGRLKFDTGNSAVFPSMLVIWH